MTPKDKKQLVKEIAGYERSIRPDYIAKKMVMGYVKIIDPHFRRDAINRNVWHKAKKCATQSTEDILSVIQSNMDVRHTIRSEQDRELVKVYEKVIMEIKQLKKI